MEKQSLERHRVEQRQARVASPAALLASGLLLAGCATHLPPPPGLDLRGAAVVAGTAVPTLDISGLPGGKAELTTAGWTAVEATALRGVMDVCVRRVADRLLLDLLAAPPPAELRGRPPARNPYSTSCDDVPAAWARAASAAS